MNGSSSSGEFNSFPFVSSAVSAGGVGGEKPLFLLPHSSTFCLGSIGGTKICVKPCIDGHSCGIPMHASCKGKVEPSHFYVHENEYKIFVTPKYHAGNFSDDQIAAILSQAFTLNEWECFFKNAQEGIIPDWLPVWTSVMPDGFTDSVDQGPDLIISSPTHAVTKVGLFDIFPSLSYNDDSISEGDLETKALHQESKHSLNEIVQTLQDFKG
jgi:hypothetical protein